MDQYRWAFAEHALARRPPGRVACVQDLDVQCEVGRLGSRHGLSKVIPVGDVSGLTRCTDPSGIRFSTADLGLAVHVSRHLTISSFYLELRHFSQEPAPLLVTGALYLVTPHAHFIFLKPIKPLRVNPPISTFRVCKGPRYPLKGRPVAIVVGQARDGLPPVPLVRLEYFVFFTRDSDTLVVRAFRTLGTVPDAVAADHHDLDLSYFLKLAREDAEAKIAEQLEAFYDDPTQVLGTEEARLQWTENSYLTDLYFRVIGLGQFRQIAQATCSSDLQDYLDDLDANGAILDRRDLSA